jgi:ribosomal protein L37E
MSIPSFFNGRTRTYDKTGKLVAWIQGKCIRCGKFLGKGRKKLCPSCVHQHRLDIRKEWGNKHPRYHTLLRHSKNSKISYRLGRVKGGDPDYRIMQRAIRAYKFQIIRNVCGIEFPRIIYKKLESL